MEEPKRNRSLEAPTLVDKRNKLKPPYLSGEDVCHVSREQADRVCAQTRNPKDLRCLWNFRQVGGKDIEVPQNFKKGDNCCAIGSEYAADLIMKAFCLGWRSLYSTCFDGRSRGEGECALVTADPAGRLCVLGVTIKNKALWVIGSMKGLI